MRPVLRGLASSIPALAAVAVFAGCSSWKVDPDPDPIPKEQEWMYRPVGTGVPGVDPAVPYDPPSRQRHSDSRD